MKQRPPNNRGFTFVEVLIALAVLAIAGIGLVGMLSTGGQQNFRRRAGVDALRLARNEAQRARSSATLVPGTGSTYRMNADGTLNTSGPYRATVQAINWCDPTSAAPNDQTGAAVPACVNALRVRVTVAYLLDGSTWTTMATHDAFVSTSNPQASAWVPAGGT